MVKAAEYRYTYKQLRRALEESLKIQSHYAEQLNLYDQGKRLVFKDLTSWMERIKALGLDK